MHRFDLEHRAVHATNAVARHRHAQSIRLPTTATRRAECSRPASTPLPLLASNNYFLAGEYYFENVTIAPPEPNPRRRLPCWRGRQPEDRQRRMPDPPADRSSDDPGGRWPWRRDLLPGRHLEARRAQRWRARDLPPPANETYSASSPSRPPASGYIASTLGLQRLVLETKSGSNNDVAIHGLVWAPYAATSLGNITNARQRPAAGRHRGRRARHAGIGVGQRVRDRDRDQPRRRELLLTRKRRSTGRAHRSAPWCSIAPTRASSQ